jgi:molecular chaperone DnaK
MDHLVLVGGPMFSPLVRRRIEKLFKRKADAVVDPRTSVAMGAACQGAILSNHDKVPFLLLDIVPFALGVLVKEPGASARPTVSFHIPRGTRIPHQNRKPYTTTEDNQPAVTVQVYQGLGDSTEPDANSRLAQFHLEGLPPAKAREPKIDISFDIDANGLLEVVATDTKTGKTGSLRIEDAIWLSPSERASMTQRMTRSQRWARERAELTPLVQQVRALVEKLQELEQKGPAQAWQRHFEAWQRVQKDPSFGHLDPGDQALLAEMYNGGQASCDQFIPALDRARNLPPRCQRFIDAAGAVNLFAADAEVEKQLHDLQELGRQLEGQARDALATLEPLAIRFQRWSAALAHCGTLHADPRDRLIACHDAGNWQRAIEAFQQAFPATQAAEVPLDVVHRHLDGLARLGRRKEYREMVADQRERLALGDLHFDRLNEFGRHVLSGIAWVVVRGLGTGSGFLAGPNLVVTNRHVVSEGDQPAGLDRITVHVGGAPRPVARIRLPPSSEIDLAVLELAEPLDSRPLRVGYTGLVEVGERVLAIGFPLPEGDSFEENLLLDHGIVNRIRTRPDRHGRELELGLKISPGMSGGPLFNDRGEVIGVSTFVRYQAAGGQQGPIVDRSSHAIAVDALHEILPRPW